MIGAISSTARYSAVYRRGVIFSFGIGSIRQVSLEFLSSFYMFLVVLSFPPSFCSSNRRVLAAHAPLVRHDDIRGESQQWARSIKIVSARCKHLPKVNWRNSRSAYPTFSTRHTTTHGSAKPVLWCRIPKRTLGAGIGSV